MGKNLSTFCYNSLTQSPLKRANCYQSNANSTQCQKHLTDPFHDLFQYLINGKIAQVITMKILTLNLIFILGSCVWFLCWSTSRKWSTLSVLQVCCNLFCIYGFLGSKVKKCTCGFRSGDYLTYFLGKGCYVVLAPIPFFTPLDLFLIPLEITFNIDQSSLIEIPSWLSPPSSFKLNQVE